MSGIDMANAVPATGAPDVARPPEATRAEIVPGVGFERTADGRVFLNIDGGCYELSDHDPIADFRAVEDRIVRDRPDPVPGFAEAAKAIERLPDALREPAMTKLIDESLATTLRWANKSKPSKDEVREFLDSEAGAAYTLYLSLAKKNASMTEELAGDIARRLTRAVWLKLRDDLNRDIIEAARRREAAKQRPAAEAQAQA